MGIGGQCPRNDRVLTEKYCDAFCGAMRAETLPEDLDGHAERVLSQNCDAERLRSRK